MKILQQTDDTKLVAHKTFGCFLSKDNCAVSNLHQKYPIELLFQPTRRKTDKDSGSTHLDFVVQQSRSANDFVCAHPQNFLSERFLQEKCLVLDNNNLWHRTGHVRKHDEEFLDNAGSIQWRLEALCENPATNSALQTVLYTPVQVKCEYFLCKNVKIITKCSLLHLPKSLYPPRQPCWFRRN